MVAQLYEHSDVADAHLCDVQPPAAPLQIPDGVMTAHRCPTCTGNLYAMDGEITCMMCARRMHVRMATPEGLPLSIRQSYRPAVTQRVGDGESQRAARGVSESQGSTGLAARLLATIPEAPEHATAWALGRPMRISTDEVRDILRELIDLGLVVEVIYQAGCVKSKYSQGYQRPRLEG